jgi:hypothetical protein
VRPPAAADPDGLPAARRWEKDIDGQSSAGFNHVTDSDEHV